MSKIVLEKMSTKCSDTGSMVEHGLVNVQANWLIINSLLLFFKRFVCYWRFSPSRKMLDTLRYFFLLACRCCILATVGMLISPPFCVRVKYLSEICYKHSKFQYMKYKKLEYHFDCMNNFVYWTNTCKTNDIPVSLSCSVSCSWANLNMLTC